MYKLEPTQDGSNLFFWMDGETANRYGAIGYLRADYGNDGASLIGHSNRSRNIKRNRRG